MQDWLHNLSAQCKMKRWAPNQDYEVNFPMAQPPRSTADWHQPPRIAAFALDDA